MNTMEGATPSQKADTAFAAVLWASCPRSLLSGAQKLFRDARSRYGTESSFFEAELDPLEVEQWLKKLKKAESLENPTLDKIRRVMNLVYKHGQRYGLIPRDESANPMRWVRQRTTSDYIAIIMNPQQAFQILLNIPEPRRTLVLTDAATALRVSEILGLMWADLDFENQVIKRAARLCLGQVQRSQIESVKSAGADASLAGRFLVGLEGTDAVCQGQRLCLSQFPVEGQEAAVGLHHGAKVSAPCRHQGRGVWQRRSRAFWFS